MRSLQTVNYLKLVPEVHIWSRRALKVSWSCHFKDGETEATEQK